MVFNTTFNNMSESISQKLSKVSIWNLEYLFTIKRGTNYNKADDPVICISRDICPCFVSMYLYYGETRADNSGYTNHRVTCLVVIVVTPKSASGSVKFSVKFFVRVHFSKTIKGIHLKLGILVHYQKRNQLQQGSVLSFKLIALIVIEKF
jgi:hypothetical protein